MEIESQNSGYVLYQTIFFVFFLIVLLNLVYLLLLHSYLMVKNLTTWEFLCWEKISYLGKFSKGKGSPFSLGVYKNVQLYFYPKINGHY